MMILSYIQYMGGSPGDVSEEPLMQEKQKKGWRMSCYVYIYIYELCSFSNLSVTSPMSQLILQPFCRFNYITAHSPTILCFTYVTAHSPILFLLLLHQRLFTYVTWRAAHANFYKRLGGQKICLNSVLVLPHNFFPDSTF